MTTNMHLIPFDRDSLTAFEQEGQLYIAIKPICERLGVSFASQTVKLNSDRQRWGVSIIETPTSNQAMLCLPKGKLFGWLNSIHPGKVAETARPALRRFQNECDAVLDAWWSKRMGIRADGPIAFEIDRDKAVLDLAQVVQMLVKSVADLGRDVAELRSDRQALVDYQSSSAFPRLRLEPEEVDLAPFRMRRPERPAQRITPTDRKEIEVLFRAGFSGADVARAMNMSPGLVRRIRRTLEDHAMLAPDPQLYQQRKQLMRNIASKPRPRKTLDPQRSQSARRQYGMFDEIADVR